MLWQIDTQPLPLHAQHTHENCHAWSCHRHVLCCFGLPLLQIEVCNTMQPVLLQQGLQGSPLGPAGLGPASFALGSGSIAGP